MELTAGQAFEGGFYAGKIRIDGKIYAIIVAPKSTELNDEWDDLHKFVSGATSFFNGKANTKAMAEAGSTLAKQVLGLHINGRNDWYIPSRDELELCYRNLKPDTCKNYCYRGDNPSSIPPGYAYTPDTPAQTSAELFTEDASEAFDLDWYWTSTQHADYPDYAWLQYFDGGDQLGSHKSNSYQVRPVRRVLLADTEVQHA